MLRKNLAGTVAVLEECCSPRTDRSAPPAARRWSSKGPDTPDRRGCRLRRRCVRGFRPGRRLFGGVSDDNTVLRVPLVAADPSASTGDQNHPVPFLLAEQGECTFCQFVFVEREGPGDLVMPGVPGLVDNAEIFAGGGVPEFRERACPSLPVDVSGEDARTVLGAETRTPPCCLVQVLRNAEHSGLAV